MMKPNINRCSLIFLFLNFVFRRQTTAAIKLPMLMCDRMVFQRDEPVTVRSKEDAGEKIEIEFLGIVNKTRTDRNGNWQLELEATAAGGPYSMTKSDVMLNDILVDDFWLASAHQYAIHNERYLNCQTPGWQ